MEQEQIRKPNSSFEFFPSLDTTTNGMRIDIKSITKNNNKTIHHAIERKTEQLNDFNSVFGQNSDSLILYFHDASYYDEYKVLNELSLNYTRRHFNKIICVINDNSQNGSVIEIIRHD